VILTLIEMHLEPWRFIDDDPDGRADTVLD
jgi:hypothetical protein